MSLQMSWENKPGRPAQLRHPDGSPDIAAYSRIAHRERAAAIASVVRETLRILLATPSIVARALGWSGRIQLNAPLGVDAFALRRRVRKTVALELVA
jgi:hypothetical protein